MSYKTVARQDFDLEEAVRGVAQQTRANLLIDWLRPEDPAGVTVRKNTTDFLFLGCTYDIVGPGNNVYLKFDALPCSDGDENISKFDLKIYAQSEAAAHSARKEFQVQNSHFNEISLIIGKEGKIEILQPNRQEYS